MNEDDRLRALHDFALLDTPNEQEFDELVNLASEVCSTPISLVSLLDHERQWFKAAVGTTLKETPRNISFCTHTIQKPELFIVEDAAMDPRFSDSPLVTGEMGVRFYAAIPLQAPDGYIIGTLCVMDTVPRVLSESQKRALTILGNQVQARMELKAKKNNLKKALAENERLSATLTASNAIFRAFMNNGPFISYIKDADGRFVFCNKKLAERFGVTEQQWIGQTDHELWPREIANQYRENDMNVLQRGIPVQSAEVTPGPNGEDIHWKSYKFPLRDQSGSLMLAGMSVDVTSDLKKEAQLESALQETRVLAKSLQASQLLLHKFLDVSPNRIFLKAEDGRYVFYNRAFASQYGIGPMEWISRSDHEILPKEIADRLRESDHLALHSGEVIEAMEQSRNSDGVMLTLKTLKFTYKDADGRNMLAGVAIDITEEVKRQEALAEANLKLELLATTDSLTGLSNRRVFETQAAIEFSIATRKNRPLCLLIMDVDNFKKRNDEFGHAAGDEALRLLGEVLLETCRAGDLAARLGGEEFGFLLPETDVEAAMAFAQRIQSRLREIPCGPTELTVSIGIAARSEKTETWERLASRADAAMYEAKQSGKSRAVIHRDHITQVIQNLNRRSQAS
jgi:diguanylate cyclase (GGDEF)-like protein/PAS domain S-box-containing protein